MKSDRNLDLCVSEFNLLEKGIKTFHLVFLGDYKDLTNGDIIRFSEYDFQKSEYTGRIIQKLVLYIQYGHGIGLPESHAIVGFGNLV